MCMYEEYGTMWINATHAHQERDLQMILQQLDVLLVLPILLVLVKLMYALLALQRITAILVPLLAFLRLEIIIILFFKKKWNLKVE